LIHYLLNFRKHSNQVELDQFFTLLQGKNEASQFVTKSAFTQVRKNVSHEAFIDLNHLFIESVYSVQKDNKTWKGFRLCAIDGSSARLPYEPNIIDSFGVQKGKPNQADVSMGMISVFYDCLNNMAIDASINPNNTSERECAMRHHEFSTDHDLIIYDRGYAGFMFYMHHMQRNLSFCIRAKTHRDNVVRDFISSHKKEAVVTYNPTKQAIKSCKEKGLPITPIKLRLIRVNLPNEVEVLITNLMDEKKYKHRDFKQLYHMRWGIEENYKRLKQWGEIENFSGKSALSVKQDFYAKILASNLTSLMVRASQKCVKKKSKKLILDYKVNFAQALSKMKHRLILLLRNMNNDLIQAIRKTMQYISQTTEAVREGRSFPRNLKNIKNDIHYPSYKNAL